MQYLPVTRDFSETERLVLPSRKYQIVMSVQALHHVPHAKKHAVFRFVADLLAEGGIFLLMDRIALDAVHFADLYRAAWNHLEQESAVKSGQSGNEFLKQLQPKEDYSAALEEHREAGFSATCLHCYLNRALFAVKPRWGPMNRPVWDGRTHL